MIGKTIEKASPWIGLLVLGIFLLLAASVVKTSIFGEVDGEKHIYFEVVFLILLAIAGELLVVYTKQPTVMILMVLGVLMSLVMTVLITGTLLQIIATMFNIGYVWMSVIVIFMLIDTVIYCALTITYDRMKRMHAARAYAYRSK